MHIFSLIQVIIDYCFCDGISNLFIIHILIMKGILLHYKMVAFQHSLLLLNSSYVYYRDDIEVQQKIGN